MNHDEASSLDDQHPTLGKRVHEFVTRRGQRAERRRKRMLEAMGFLALCMVPLGLGTVKGAIGTIVAVLGGVVGLMAYLLSSKRKSPIGLTITICEKGLVCSQGTASRQLLWNEIVDISSRNMPMPKGPAARALVLDVVAEPPLLIVVGGAFSNDTETKGLLDALAATWLPVWCNRARVLVETERPLHVGLANVACDSMLIDGGTVSWTDIQGVDRSSGVPALLTKDGPVQVEEPSASQPFPSAAERLAAIAQAPPSPPLLPAPRCATKELPSSSVP